MVSRSNIVKMPIFIWKQMRDGKKSQLGQSNWANSAKFQIVLLITRWSPDPKQLMWLECWGLRCLRPLAVSWSCRGLCSHWYSFGGTLLGGGWQRWLNLALRSCHQCYCVGILRVPALQILCYILSSLLPILPLFYTLFPSNLLTLLHPPSFPPSGIAVHFICFNV